MKHVNYSDKPDHAATQTHRSVDEMFEEKNLERRDRYEEGFASASGISNETAESGGRIRHPENKDRSRPDPVAPELEEENAGLADN